MSWFRLTATITHKTFPEPLVKQLFFEGDTRDAVVDQMETLPQHKANLKMHGRAAFKDAHGVKHAWKLDPMPHMNS